MHPHRLSAIVLNEPSEAVAHMAGPRERQYGVLAIGHADLRGNELTKGGGADQPPRAHATAVQHEPHPLGHVRHTRPDGATWRDTIGTVDGDDAHGAIPFRVWHGDIWFSNDRRDQCFRLRHA